MRRTRRLFFIGLLWLSSSDAMLHHPHRVPGLVGELFEKNPFPNAPPRFMRTRTFEYRFAPWSERGAWWTRTETGAYCPSVMLDSGGALRRAL